MSDFQTAVADMRKLDPSKRVNYPFGLVLGVDEFLQEQTHFLEKHRRHNRMLHGFGTVAGLKVSVPASVDPPEIRVANGLAVSRGGFDICVPNVMCAKVNDWLKANADALRDRFGSFPATVGVSVVLCYRECATDVVPIPGEPCRLDEDAMAASRLADSFELLLCIDESVGSPPSGSPPSGSPPFGSPPGSGPSLVCTCPLYSSLQAGEIEFGRLVQRIDITTTGPFSSAADFEGAVKAILDLEAGNPASPPTGPLVSDAATAPAMLATAARVWTTEVLPELLRRDKESACGPACNKCVLLADVQIQVAANGTASGGAAGVTVDETRRPILLATSLLQEWLLSGPGIV
jgi:hypothetical protein